MLCDTVFIQSMQSVNWSVNNSFYFVLRVFIVGRITTKWTQFVDKPNWILTDKYCEYIIYDFGKADDRFSLLPVRCWQWTWIQVELWPDLLKTFVYNKYNFKMEFYSCAWFCVVKLWRTILVSWVFCGFRPFYPSMIHRAVDEQLNLLRFLWRVLTDWNCVTWFISFLAACASQRLCIIVWRFRRTWFVCRILVG
jgi:hypothetical protein